MNLTEIRYTYSRFATTNPPQNISNTLDLRKRQGGAIELEKTEYLNGLTTTRIYSVTPEKFEEFNQIFEVLDILGVISKDFAAAGSEPPVPQMTGGAENHAITFIAGKVSIACFYLPGAASPIIAKLGMLAEECGEPVFETKTGADMNAKGYSAVAAATAAVAKAEAMKAAAAGAPVPAPAKAEGEWFCTECGHKNINSKFCTECGRKKD
ncbi:MAG: zinc ribbon domain-containing protein [Clostridia bacterium]|nr:zinc ribbon domain-containing protein [Clostridia bacterium]